jgi:hypothetical protein
MSIGGMGMGGVVEGNSVGMDSRGLRVVGKGRRVDLVGGKLWARWKDWLFVCSGGDGEKVDF